jgi:hypothetical protein
MHRCTSIPGSNIRPAIVILSEAKDLRLIFLSRAKIAIRDVSFGVPPSGGFHGKL